MNARHVIGLFAAVVLAVTAAQAQTNVRVRGTIAAISGNVMSVKSRDGKDLQITIPDNVAVAVARNVRFEDIKEGDFVGVTSKPGPDGIPLVRAVPGTRADLVPGEYIFTVAQAVGDGALSAARVQVSKDGVRPPQ